MYKNQICVNTHNRGEKMTHRKVRKEAIFICCALVAVTIISIFLIPDMFMKNEKEPEMDFVNKTIFENNIPVVATKEVIKRPYTDNTVKIVTNFYNSKDDEQTQQQSLILFENTYLQSTGISYQTDYDFDVVSILDGVVMTVKEDQTLGKIIEIKHNDNIISSYQSLSEILVKEGDEVKQGTIIGKSGNSNLAPQLGSHLHFELTIDSQTVDPEEYYEKELDNLN